VTASETVAAKVSAMEPATVLVKAVERDWVTALKTVAPKV
jgi:hypothetical protein